MKLDAYKKELENRASLYLINIVLALVFLLIGELLVKDLIRLGSEISWVIISFAILVELINLYQLGKIWKAVKDKEVLTKMYIKENDEREKFISLKSGFPTVVKLSIMLITIAILAAFFDKVVFFTLIGAALLQIIVAWGISLYWRKKI